MTMHHKKIGSLLSGGLMLASMSLAICSTSAPVYARSTENIASKPSINAKFTVFQADESLRVYPTPNGGQEYYTDGLPIQRGDKAKLSVLVATGAYELKHVKVRLDNTLVADLDHAPWDTIFDTNGLTLGNHMIEIWAQSDSPAPYSSDTAIINFFVAPTVATVPATQGIVTGVKGYQGTIGSDPGTTSATPTNTTQGSDVTTPAPVIAPQPVTPTTSVSVSPGPAQPVSAAVPSTPTPGSTPSTPVIVPAAPSGPMLPAVLNGFHESDGPTVAFRLDPNSAQNAHDSGKPIDLSQPAKVTVIAPAGSTARAFVYILVRNGATVYSGDHLLQVNQTRIRLQAKNGTDTGLLPGSVSLEVWGVDDQNNYGPPAMLDISVPDNQEK